MFRKERHHGRLSKETSEACAAARGLTDDPPRVPFAGMKLRSVIQWVVLIAVTCSSGCVMGYRHQHFEHQEVVNDVAVDLEGSQGTVGYSMVFDFRVLRVSSPFITTFEEVELSDDRGGRGRYDAERKSRYLRVDAPVATFWKRGNGFGLDYTGMLQHRTSIDLWIGAESDLRTEEATHWLDVGIGYYQYNLFAVRLFGGWGVKPFRGSSRYFSQDAVIDTQLQGFGGGIEITLAAGEYALDFIQYLLDIDEAQSEILPGQAHLNTP